MCMLALICAVSGILIMPAVKQIFLVPAADMLFQGAKYAELILKGIQ